ncbi:TonB-dependent receptor [Novosphingobium terrae]|uniref:TonB-dependent receptor n=1 Tax=Novosphingobium terrae TaxID=2726189 RepID=UPI00197E0BFC|nr:TonB-dependent receptor [Novosphingobium terrae]
MKTNVLLFCNTILWSAGLLVTPALAQGTDQAAPVSAAPGEIVVTAQKRPELLSKAPLSISAATGGELRSAGVTDPTSIARLMPTIKIDQAAGLQITIRGVSSADGSEKGDPSAAFMLNGVYLARQQSLSGAFFDIDRIEVLRGPQGTLYGRNATAGVVNVLTKQPTEKFEGSLNAEAGNYGTYRVDGMINMPVSDRLSVRAAAAYNKHDSYLLHGNTTNQPLGQDEDEYAARLSAKLKLGANDQGHLLLVGEYSHQGGVGPQAVTMGNFFANATSTTPLYMSNASSDSQRTVNYPITSKPYQDNKIYGITGEAAWDFGPVNLTYLGSFRGFDRNALNTYVNYNSARYADQITTGITYSNSQEVRLATSGTGPLTAVVGLYYFREKSDNVNTVLHNYAGFPLYAFLQKDVVGESKAAFGQATYAITDSFKLTAGIRYSRDDKSRLGATVYSTTSQALDPSSYTVSAINNASRVDSKVTWKAGAEYDFSHNVLAYANVATGYKAGGFNDGCGAGSPGCTSPVTDLYYRPEQLTAYETGVKGKFLHNTISASIAGFYYDYKDMQLSSPGTLGLTTLNAGKAHIKGIESQAAITPTRNDRVDLSINYLDARYVTYSPTATINFAGKQLDNSPSWTAMMGYTHTFPLANGGAIEAHGDSTLSDSYETTNFSNGVQYRYPSYTKSNASLTYRTSRGWTLTGFVKNLENTITISGYGNGRIYASEPRTYGVRAGIKF